MVNSGLSDFFVRMPPPGGRHVREGGACPHCPRGPSSGRQVAAALGGAGHRWAGLAAARKDRGRYFAYLSNGKLVAPASRG
jgi:hypothetical protein